MKAPSLAALLALSLAACAAGTAGTSPENTPAEAETEADTGADATPAPTEKSPTPESPEQAVTEPVFVDGPAITPAAELATWLAGKKGSLLRLPLVVEVTGWSVGPAWIGMTDADAPADAVHIELDQGALGVGLTERLTPLCGEPPARCVVWIQGYWGPNVPMPELPLMPGETKKEPFAVREVVGLVAEGDTPHVKVLQK